MTTKQSYLGLKAGDITRFSCWYCGLPTLGRHYCSEVCRQYDNEGKLLLGECAHCLRDGWVYEKNEVQLCSYCAGYEDDEEAEDVSDQYWG